MIYQLLKRDDVWRILPYYVLGCAVIYPFFGASVMRAAFLSAMLGFGAAVAGFQRATRFQAGLPIAARQLFLARLISLLGILWLPALAGAGMMLLVTGTAHAASASAVAKVVVAYTLVIALLQSIRVRDLSLPIWKMFPVMFLFSNVGILAATSAVAVPVLALCLPLSAVLLLRTWIALPRSYQLAPAGRHPRTISVPDAEPLAGRLGASGGQALLDYERQHGQSCVTGEERAKTTGSSSPAAVWWPVLHSVFPGLGLFYLAWAFMGAMSGTSAFGSFGVAMLWFLARQPSRWLWSVPINARALLLTILTPILLALTGGYFAGLYLPKKSPIPVPDLNIPVLNLAAVLVWALLVVLSMVLYDWRRLGRMPKWVRALPALLLIGIPALVRGGVMLFASSAATKQFERSQREILQAIWNAIPGGVFGAVAVTAVALAALYWAVEKVFSEPEFAGKPHPPQDFESGQR